MKSRSEDRVGTEIEPKRRITTRASGRSRRLAAGLAVAAMWLSACVSTPRIDHMQPEATSSRSFGTVAVSYDPNLRVYPDVGGFGKSITPERFAAAVEKAVVASGLFSGTAPREQADFLLDATAINVELDIIDKTMGYVLGYHVVAEWKLERAGESRVVFNEIIAARGRATIGDAFNGMTRNTVAREDGARKNINEGIRRLSALDL